MVHLSPQALDIPRVLVNEPVFKIVNCGSNAEIGPDTIRLAPAGQPFVGFGFDEDDVVANGIGDVARDVGYFHFKSSRNPSDSAN